MAICFYGFSDSSFIITVLFNAASCSVDKPPFIIIIIIIIIMSMKLLLV
jgi:hypothetical protein